MSASRLRAAAVVLREVAGAASPGPWRVHPVERPRADVRGLLENTDHDYRGNAVATAASSEFGACAIPDAEFIALMDPVVAVALADWLEAEAKPPRFYPSAEADALAEKILEGRL